MIDGQVDNKSRSMRMDTINEFFKLIEGRGFTVVYDKGWVYTHKVGCGIGAAKAAIASVRRRGWIDREQVNDATAKILGDVLVIVQGDREMCQRVGMTE